MFFLGLGIGLIVGGIAVLLVGVLLFASARKKALKTLGRK